MKILTRFSILARLISHVSKTNTIQEFNFTLAYLLNDLLPDGEKHLKIKEDACENSLSRKTSTLKHYYSRDLKIPELTRGVVRKVSSSWLIEDKDLVESRDSGSDELV